MKDRTAIWWWIVAWCLVAILVATGVLMPLDRSISLSLSTLGQNVPATNLIWVFGGLPLTGIIVIGVALYTPKGGWRVVLGFVVGLAIEVLAKHFITTPFPRATPEPAFFSALETATNLTPSLALHWMHQLLGVHLTASGPHQALFRGSFPSGHVFRISYAAGALLKYRRRAWTWLVAGIAGVLVVATGGHWATDVLGGFFLARAFLEGLAFRPKSARKS